MISVNNYEEKIYIFLLQFVSNEMAAILHFITLAKVHITLKTMSVKSMSNLSIALVALNTYLAHVRYVFVHDHYPTSWWNNYHKHNTYFVGSHITFHTSGR